MKDIRYTWRFWLCAFTWHSWVPLAAPLRLHCTFCNAERRYIP